MASASLILNLVVTAKDQAVDGLKDKLASLAKVTAVVGAGLALSAKEAIAWESAWTGVAKTVDGSAAEMGALEKQLRALATTLPTTHQEVAALAEAAGQMGVARENIASFTKTAIALGATTNLVAEEAATALAKFSAVMGTAQDQSARLGATLVALGNAGNSTEADIVSMAQRISGAGRTVGLAESDVLALASAMSDLGIEAQLGGAVMQRTLLAMFTAVQNGGAQLEKFAAASKMSATEFAAAFNSDPAAALQAFIAGLRQTSDAGGNIIAVLKDLKIKGNEDIAVLTRLTGGVDSLNAALTVGAEAWRRPLALLEESEKRYGTTASQIQVARNQLRDLAVDIGGVLLPDIARLAGGLQSTAEAAQKVPGPFGEIALQSLKAVAALTLLSGGFLLLAARIAIARLATTTLATTMPRLAAAVDFVRSRFVLLAAAMVVAAAVDVGAGKLNALMEQARGANIDVLQLRRSTLDFVDTGHLAGEAARVFGEDLGKLRAAIDKVDVPFWKRIPEELQTWARSIPVVGKLQEAFDNLAFGEAAFELQDARKLLEAFDAEAAQFAENGMLAEALVLVEQAAQITGLSVEELAARMPKLTAAILEQEYAAEISARANEKFGDSAKKAGGDVADALFDVEKYAKELDGVVGASEDVDKANLKNAERWRDISDAAEEAADAIDQVRDAERALRDAREEGPARIAAAERELRDAREDGPRAVADAERDLARAREDGPGKIADAERSLAEARQKSDPSAIADAERELTRARQDGPRAVQDAELALRDAREEGPVRAQEAERALRDAREQGVLGVVEAEKGVTKARTEANDIATGQLDTDRRRVEFAEMLRERLERVRAGAALLSEAGISGSDLVDANMRSANDQADQMADQMRRMGASQQEILEFAGKLRDIPSPLIVPNVDTAPAKEKVDGLARDSQTYRTFVEQPATAKVETGEATGFLTRLFGLGGATRAAVEQQMVAKADTEAAVQSLVKLGLTLDQAKRVVEQNLLVKVDTATAIQNLMSVGLTADHAKRVVEQQMITKTETANSKKNLDALGREAGTAKSKVEQTMTTRVDTNDSKNKLLELWNGGKKLAANGVQGGLGGFLGNLFADGGWTGNMPAGQIAGVVHGQEYVVRAGPAAANLPLLEYLNNGGGAPRIGSTVPSFAAADGGSSMPRSAQSPGGGGMTEAQMERAMRAAINGATLRIDGNGVARLVSREQGREADLRARTR